MTNVPEKPPQDSLPTARPMPSVWQTLKWSAVMVLASLCVAAISIALFRWFAD